MVGSFYPPAIGGIETHMAYVAIALKSKGVDVTVTCLSLGDDGLARPQTEMIEGIQVRRVGSLHIGENLLWPSAFHYLESPDIVHFHGFSRPLLLRSWLDKGRAPLVITPHGGLRNIRADPQRLRRSIKRAFDLTGGRLLLNRASRIIALTTEEAGHIEAVIGVRRRNITVLPNPLPASSFALHPDRQGESGRLLVLSRLGPGKRIEDLLNALLLLPNPPGCDIVGPDAGSEAALRQLARSFPEGTVSFLGPVYGEAKTRVIRRARALVLPSVAEGLSMSALEALVQGTPVIASDAASVGIPASACLRFPVGDKVALAACLSALEDVNVIATLREGSERARSTVYRVEDYAASLLALYQRAIERSPLN